MIEFRTREPRRAQLSVHGAYEDIYRNESIQNRDSLYLWILKLAAPRQGQRLLDVSCGTGRLVDFAARSGVVAVGLDFAEAALVAGKRARHRGSLVAGDAEALPFASASFDRVINVGSLEHYDRPERGVAEMARVLAPGGRAIVLLPNTFGYQHVLYAWRHGTVFDDGQPLQRYGTPVAWRELLEAHGLKVRQIWKYQRLWPRTLADLFWYLRQPRLLFQLALSPFIPVNAASCLVYGCEKAD